MARIRSIKPEFWSSEQVMNCSTNARLFFIGLWNFCDDAGRHPLAPVQLKALIFPGDTFSSANIRGMIDELSSNGLLTPYTVDGKEYLSITGWRHQKIDRPQPPKYPAPTAEGGVSLVEHSSSVRDGAQRGEVSKKQQVVVQSLVEHSSSVRKDGAASRWTSDERIRIEGLCRQAAGLENHPNPSLNIISPILALIDRGYDLEADILPVMRTKAQVSKKPIHSWGYFLKAIEEQFEANASIKSKPSGNGGGLPDYHAEREAKWRMWLSEWFKSGFWSPVCGDPPGDPHCEIPPSFVEKIRAEQGPS